MDRADYRREVDEALYAGQEALRCLERAKSCLNSARNWGIADMLGGGMIITLVKRSKMKDAEALVQQAGDSLRRFQRELADVAGVSDIHIQTGDLLGFADYFFDSFLVDIMVQSKIKEAKRQVEDAIQKVEQAMRQLEDWRRDNL